MASPGARCKATSSRSLQEEWLGRLSFGPHRDTDHLVQMWLGIFPVSWNQLPVDGAEFLRSQIETIRLHLDGSFADLLGAMLFDPSVQLSLNGPSNRRNNPNENLARELLELFTLGEGQFQETDVIAVSKALTGFQLNRKRQVVLNSRSRFNGTLTILGRTAVFDPLSLAAWLCEQPATALHISRRVWLQLVGSLPPVSRLEEISEEWLQRKLSLPWLVQTLRTSPEAALARTRATKLSDPIRMLTRSLALLGSRHPDALRISRIHLSRMGQVPFEPPSVKGWPVNDEWINLRWLQARRRGLQALLADEEVWASRNLPDTLGTHLTAIPPLTIDLPAEPTRSNLARLWADPVWQLS